MHDIDTSEDFANKGKVKLAFDGCGILNHAAQVYTRTIFYKFQDEFSNIVSWKKVNVEIYGSRYSITLQKDGYNRKYSVTYDVHEGTILCSCHMFETLG